MTSLDPTAQTDTKENQQPDVEREQKFLIDPDTLSTNIDLLVFPHSEITQRYIHHDAVITLKGTPGNYAQLIYLSREEGTGSFVKISLTDEQHVKLAQITYKVADDCEVLPENANVRVRRKGDKMFQTVKLPSGEETGSGIKSRPEVEFEIDNGQYELLAGYTEGIVIKKTRYTLMKSDNFEVICDVFDEPFNGLILIEAEALGDADFGKLSLPLWASSKNVSNVPGFSNAELARMSGEEIEVFMGGLAATHDVNRGNSLENSV